MKQYTLLFILDDSKVVNMKTFISMRELKDYSKYVLYVKKELNSVDKDGYVWFVEIEDELDDILYEATSDVIDEELLKKNDELIKKDIEEAIEKIKIKEKYNLLATKYANKKEE